MNGAPSSFDTWRVGERARHEGFSFYSRLNCSVTLSKPPHCVCLFPHLPSRSIVCYPGELSAADTNSSSPLTVCLPLSSCGSPLGNLVVAVDHSGLYDALNPPAKLEDSEHQKVCSGQQTPLVISSLHSFWLGVCTWLQSPHFTMIFFCVRSDRTRTAPVCFFPEFPKGLF